MIRPSFPRIKWQGCDINPGLLDPKTQAQCTVPLPGCFLTLSPSVVKSLGLAGGWGWGWEHNFQSYLCEETTEQKHEQQFEAQRPWKDRARALEGVLRTGDFGNVDGAGDKVSKGWKESRLS